MPIVLKLTALCGLPGDRDAMIAARRRFVTLKDAFMRAVAEVPGSIGDTLRHKVRQATDPLQLWRLRRAVIGTLNPVDERAIAVRRELQRRLAEEVPPSFDGSTSFVTL
jgi:hypothetical protein